MIKIILIVLSLSFAKVQGEKVNRAELRKKILAGCIEMSSAVADKKQLICKCIVENFDKKANDHQLKLLAENYGGKVADDVGKEVTSSAVQTFDYEVATKCVENPTWRLKD